MASISRHRGSAVSEANDKRPHGASAIEPLAFEKSLVSLFYFIFLEVLFVQETQNSTPVLTPDQQEQQKILDERTLDYQKEGLSYQAAYDKTLETVALPGFSEHETGLAMDVVCSVFPTWLHEHCWEYGFILRYPEGKEDITGISYEHWHYRYVGTKVSMAMKDTGLCLEEYVGAA